MMEHWRVSMKRPLCVLAGLVLSAVAASADVTVTMSISGAAGQVAISGTTTSWAKGTKMRVDTETSGQSLTILSDSATKQQWKIDHNTRQIEPFDATATMAALPVSFGDVKAVVTPNGQTKVILGRQCQGYTVDVRMPMTLAGETIVVKLSGPAWIAKDGAGVAELMAAQKALSDIGMSTSPLAQGPQGKGMAEATKVLSASGVVMEQENQMTMEGTGQMAQMMSQMGSMTFTTRVTAITTDPIPDSKFALPEGYSKK
jgi:hypothetical protein